MSSDPSSTETRTLLSSIRAGAPRFAAEMLFLVAVYFVYMIVRKFVISDIEIVSFDNAMRVVAFEFGRGFFWEPQWQAWAIDHAKGLIILFNWIYIITYAPIIVITAIAVYVKDRPKYFYYRNVILVSFFFALILFAAFPLAPPRFMPEHGFVDTIHEFGGLTSWYGGRDMAAAIYYNVFAAMPSLHFSWTVIFGVLFFRMKHKWLRPFGILYPTMTFFAIIFTGNHYILDAVGGGAVALASYLLYEGFLRLKLPSPLPWARNTVKLHSGRAAAYLQNSLIHWKLYVSLALANIKSHLKFERPIPRNRKTGFPV